MDPTQESRRSGGQKSFSFPPPSSPLRSPPQSGSYTQSPPLSLFLPPLDLTSPPDGARAKRMEERKKGCRRSDQEGGGERTFSFHHQPIDFFLLPPFLSLSLPPLLSFESTPSFFPPILSLPTPSSSLSSPSSLGRGRVCVQGMQKEGGGGRDGGRRH